MINEYPQTIDAGRQALAHKISRFDRPKSVAGDPRAILFRAELFTLMPLNPPCYGYYMVNIQMLQTPKARIRGKNKI
jgi:hypothetical protein